MGESVEEVCDEEMVLSTIGLLFGLVGMAYFTGEMVRHVAVTPHIAPPVHAAHCATTRHA